MPAWPVRRKYEGMTGHVIEFKSNMINGFFGRFEQIIDICICRNIFLYRKYLHRI